MKKNITLILILILFLAPLGFLRADSVVSGIKGRILLQVEHLGQAWYVDPGEGERYSLGRPEEAFSVMRQVGRGISDQDLQKIPVATDIVSGQDSDSDGLPDAMEDALGTDSNLKDTDGDGFSDKEEFQNNFNPLGEGYLPIDKDFSNKHSGVIFLQVENNGEAWYVSPTNNKRYFLGRPRDAFNLMRSLGLGISNRDLEEIPKKEFKEATSTSQVLSEDNFVYTSGELERGIHDMVNQKRREWGLNEVEWNSEVARVARMHSQSLKEESEELTSGGDTCDLPLIHHEGLELGLYNKDRLHNQGVYYFSQSGENIALVSTIVSTFYISDQDINGDTFVQCEETRGELNSQFRADLEEADSGEVKKEIIRQEIKDRKEIFQGMETVSIESQAEKTEDEVVYDIVRGWMNSPPHRKNILHTDFDQAGIGVAEVNGYVIATQSFIKRADCGYKDASCCQRDGYYPYCYNSWKCQEGTCVSK